jgi:hypothetical protein
VVQANVLKIYWSYDKVNHKDGAMIPEGRVLIDTAKSFVYTEGRTDGDSNGLKAVGLSPNLTSRFTPGTLISSYEVYEAPEERRGRAFQETGRREHQEHLGTEGLGQGRYDLPAGAWRV